MQQHAPQDRRFNEAVHTNAGFVPMDKNDKHRRIAAQAVAPRKEAQRGKQWARPSFGKRTQYEVN